MSVSERRRQRHNLQRLHGECELNYVRLLRLMPGPPKLGQSIGVDFTLDLKSGMSIRVDEVTRYTHLLSMFAEGIRPEWLPEIQFNVRIYHDAMMAEVVECCCDST